MGKGFGHLMMTLFIAALLIFAGLAIEWLVRRSTENLRRQILDTASLGRLQFLGRVAFAPSIEYARPWYVYTDNLCAVGRVLR